MSTPKYAVGALLQCKLEADVRQGWRVAVVVKISSNDYYIDALNSSGERICSSCQCHFAWVEDLDNFAPLEKDFTCEVDWGW